MCVHFPVLWRGVHRRLKHSNIFINWSTHFFETSKHKISLYVWPCLNDKTHDFWTKRSNIYLDFGVFGTKHTFRFRWYLPSDLRKSSKKHQKTNVTSKCMYVRLPFLNGFYHAFRVKHSNIFVGMSIQKRPKLVCMFPKTMVNIIKTGSMAPPRGKYQAKHGFDIAGNRKK